MAGAFSEEKENFMRLVVLVNEKGAEVFQECLLHFSTRHYGVRTFDHVLYNAKGALQKLRGRVITAQQWLTLYPPGGVAVQTSQLDITLCFVLLRNICGLIPPLTTWDKPPAPGDNSAEGGLAQLKNIRNFLCHSQKPELSDADFKTHFDNAVDAILNIERNLPHWTVTYADLTLYKRHPISLAQEADMIDVLKEWTLQDTDTRKKLNTISGDMEGFKHDLGQAKAKTDKIETTVEAISQGQEGMNESLGRVGKDVNEIKEKVDEMYLAQRDVKTTKEKDQNEEDERAFLVRLQKELKAVYMRMYAGIQYDPLNPQKTLPLKDLCVRLGLGKDSQQSVVGETIPLKHYKEMFQNQEKGKEVRRILVHGRPGIGKTTFAKLLVYDWSNGNESYLKRFEAVFLLLMRNVKPEQSLVDIIKEQLLRCRPDLVEGLTDHFMNSGNFLFIFEGLDELGKRRTSEINDILNGFKLRDACVLITSRPWLVFDLAASHCSIDQHVRIEGFEREDIVKFIVHFFSKFSVDYKTEIPTNLLQDIDQKNIWDLAKIPLVLNMICFLFHHEGNLQNTMSKLYREILHLFYKNGSKKTKVRDEQDFNEILMKLGKFAYEGLMKENEQLFFEYDEVIALIGERAFEIGFISCEMVKDRMGDDTKVQFLHYSFQEYLAACYTCQEMEKGNEQPWDEMKKQTERMTRDTSLLLEFIAGENEVSAIKVKGFIHSMAIAIPSTTTTIVGSPSIPGWILFLSSLAATSGLHAPVLLGQYLLDAIYGLFNR